MRQFFILLFTFFSLCASAQTPTSTQYLGAHNTLVLNRGHLRTDSTFQNALRDTAFTPARLGIQVFRQADSALYLSVSTTVRPYWARVGSSGGSGGVITVVHDSIFITTRDTVYNLGTTIDTLPLSTRINELLARRDTLSITQPDSLHIIICQPSIGVCDTLEFAAGVGSESDPVWTADKPSYLTSATAAATYQPLITTSKQTQTASGSTTFTFTAVPASYDDYLVFRNGVQLVPTTDYTTSGNVITFLILLAAGDIITFQRLK